MADFVNDILTSIKSDMEFKYNPVLMAVVENLEAKRANYKMEEDYLKFVKESLASANAYLKNARIEDFLVKIDERLGDEAVTNVHTKVNRMYYEVELPAALQEIRESTAYAEPVVKKYVDFAMSEMQTTRVPYFKYLPGFVNTMAMYSMNETVNKWVTKFNQYIVENKKKLIMLETVHYLDGIGNGFYRGVTEKLKPFIVQTDYSSSKIMLEMKDFSSMPVIKDMVMALQAEEAASSDQFQLGPGDGNTRVYNYIGPVLKEDNNMVLFIDGTFINLTSNNVDEKNVRHVFGVSGDITVQELAPEHVYESMSQYYQLSKSFEYLGFNVDEKRVWTKLRNIKVDFKVNEHGNLDLYLNDQHIEDPKAINFHQMFVLENNYVKNCSNTLFTNMDKVYNVEFVKLLVNESRNAATIVICVNEDYYVYDFIDAKKRDIYKADGFALQKFIFEKFGYDVRSLFNIQINDVKGKVGKIEEKKREIENALGQLEESHRLLGETIAKPGIQPKDMQLMKELREKVEREMVALKNAFVLLEDERAQTMGQRTPDAPVDYKAGDTVSFGDSVGRIVSVPSSPSENTYMVYTTEGRTEKVEKDQMQKTQAQDAQETNESKKEKKAQAQDDKKDDKAQDQAQDQAQAQDDKKDDKAQDQDQAQDDKKDDKAQDQAQAQDQDQAQDQAQAQDDKKDDKAQDQAQAQEQGVMPQQPEDKSGKFQKISADLGQLQSALETVRPEVREKFTQLGADLQTLIKQTGELERVHGEMSGIKSDKVDSGKVQKKFDKILSSLESVAAELTDEFGKGAQEVVVSESLISSAYDKYIAVVSGVADKLSTKVSNIVKKLSGDIIDLDADVKVMTARANAAQAKDQLSSQAPAQEIPVAGQQQAAQAAAAQPEINSQSQMPGQTQTISQPQSTHAQETQQSAQAQETPQSVQQEAQQAVQQAQEQPQQDENDEKYTFESLNSMTDAQLAGEYAVLFSVNESDILPEISKNKADYVNEIVQEYAAFKKRKQ